MDFVYQLILILHFIGLASVVGGFLVQMRSAEKASIRRCCTVH